MKKLVISFLVPFTVFISSHGYTQEIDASIVKNLSSDQMAMAKEALISNKIATPVTEDSSNKKETLKNNEADEKSILKEKKY